MLALLLLQTSFRHAPTAEFRKETLDGFTVMVSPAAQADSAAIAKVLPALRSHFEEIGRLVPRKAFQKLQKVRFWIEHDDPEVPGMTFHPGAGWLREHGFNVDKAGGVEIGNLEHFFTWRPIQPFMELHELSHAWEFRFMDPASQRALTQAYDDAKRSQTYDWVLYANGKRRRAYAMSNQHEYFAEISEAYFGRNDFYPFNRAELRQHDPEGYALVEQAWGIRR